MELNLLEELENIPNEFTDVIPKAYRTAAMGTNGDGDFSFLSKPIGQEFSVAAVALWTKYGTADAYIGDRKIDSFVPGQVVWYRVQAGDLNNSFLNLSIKNSNGHYCCFVPYYAYNLTY